MPTFITLRKPSGREKRYRLQKHVRDSKSSTYESLESPELDIVNARLADGTFTQSEALAQARDIQRRMQAILLGTKEKRITHSENMAILDRYWAKEYAHRDTVDDGYSMRRSIIRALELVGDRSLVTIPQDELQALINKAGTSGKQRRAASRINQLLAFLGRDFRMKLKRRDGAEPRHLTADEVRRIMVHLPGDTERLAVRAAFATGCRLGELFAITPRSFRGHDAIEVSKQLTEDGETRAPKTRRTRRVLIVSGFERDVAEWAAMTKADDRMKRWAEIVRRACEKAFPTDRTKRCGFHDLRHSYAIHMLNSGLSLSTVANLLGNSVHVCQTYYTGFSLTDEGLEAARQALRSSTPT
jgi:integrase